MRLISKHRVPARAKSRETGEGGNDTGAGVSPYQRLLRYAMGLTTQNIIISAIIKFSSLITAYALVSLRGNEVMNNYTPALG